MAREPSQRLPAAPTATRELVLGIDGFAYPDLHRPEKLAELLSLFESALARDDADASAKLAACRASPDGLGSQEVSAAILAVAPHVERFVAKLFRISDALAERAKG